MKRNITSVEDLANDDDFIRWVKEGAIADDQFWSAWMKNNADRIKLAEEAKQLILSLNFRNQSLNQNTINEKWQELEKRISNDNVQGQVFLAKKKSVNPNYWLKIAAVATPLLFLAGIVFYLLTSSYHNIERTGYGVTKSITLPDGSLVTLNANSEISYAKDWNSSSNREVKLKGEAFFQVIHTASNQKFIVYTDKIKIQVLGTQFNVNSRKNKEQVVLTSGKVKLETKSFSERKEIFMTPGEMVEMKDDELLIKKFVEPEKFSSWKDGQIILDNTSIAEIIEMLQDNYGYTVDVKNPSILNKRLYSTTTIETKNIDLIMTILSELYNIDIIQTNGKKLEIKEK